MNPLMAEANSAMLLALLDLKKALSRLILSIHFALQELLEISLNGELGPGVLPIYWSQVCYFSLRYATAFHPDQ